jgi:arginine decarboxylase
MPRHQADLIFLWDEAWSGFARFSPFLRPRTAMGAAADIEDAGCAIRPPSRPMRKQQADSATIRPTRRCSTARLIPDPRLVRLRVYQTNSTHKSMSAIRQGSMLLVKDVDFHTVEAQFHEAVFTHASTSPNQQLIASLDVARRQMELEGYGLVMNAIEIALKIRRGRERAPADLEILPRARGRRDDPRGVPPVGLQGLSRRRLDLGTAVKAMREDEFYLDPTRMTLVCGTAGFDGTQFKGLLAKRVWHPAQQDLAQQRAAAVQHQQHAQRRRASHPRAGRDLPRHREAPGRRRRGRACGLRSAREVADDRRARSSQFQPFPRGLPRRCRASTTPKATCAHAFFNAYDASDCEYVPLIGPSATSGCARGRRWSRPTSSSPIRRASRSWCRAGADAGDDRLHAQARCEGDPWLRESQGAQAGQTGRGAAKAKR